MRSISLFIARQFPAFPFGGRRPSELYERQVAFAQQMTEEVVPPVEGGLPAGTIERASLTAMWAGGEVPGSEGKPPKKSAFPVPLNERMLFIQCLRQKRNPMERFPRDSGIPCKPGKSARAHIAVAQPHSTVCAGMPLFAGSDVGVFTLCIDQLPVCRFAQGAALEEVRLSCLRIRCPSLVDPLPSPLGVRTPGKMSGGHFSVRTGRLGPWEVDRRRRDG